MVKRVIVGVTGASGAIYGYRLLEMLGQAEVERHLVLSKAGLLTAHHEMGLRKDDWTTSSIIRSAECWTCSVLTTPG